MVAVTTRSPFLCPFRESSVSGQKKSFGSLGDGISRKESSEMFLQVSTEEVYVHPPNKRKRREETKTLSSTCKQEEEETQVSREEETTASNRQRARGLERHAKKFAHFSLPQGLRSTTEIPSFSQLYVCAHSCEKHEHPRTRVRRPNEHR